MGDSGVGECGNVVIGNEMVKVAVEPFFGNLQSFCVAQLLLWFILVVVRLIMLQKGPSQRVLVNGIMFSQFWHIIFAGYFG